MVVDTTEVEKLIVDELNELSLDERERVTDEIHGVSASKTGTDDKDIEEALSKMRIELDRYFFSIDFHNVDFAGRKSSLATHEESTDNIDSLFTKSRGGLKKRSLSSSFRSRDSSLSSSSHSSSMSTNQYDAYREARSKNSSLISDKMFLRGFLVAESLNPKRAALRMMKYLEFIRDLYHTSDVLFRPIFTDDLDVEAKEQLEMGSYQMLPDRDSSGRRIFVYLRDICPNTVHWKHRAQVYVYFAQRLVEDSDGIVCVTFLHNSALFTGIEDKLQSYERSRRVNECMPSRFDAIHLCLPNKPFFHIVKAAILLTITKENRYRVRIHLGSHLECHHSLATFGIPVKRLPMALDLNTTLRKDNITYHTKWLRMQKAKEAVIREIHLESYRESLGSSEERSQTEEDFFIEPGDVDGGEDTKKPAAVSSTTDNTDTFGIAITGVAAEVVGMEAVNIFRSKFIECPRHEDCLFGRGRNTMKHPGNVAMRSILDGKRDRYACAAHQKKAEIAWEVVREITMGGGRFLKELDTGLYTLVEDETARKKISIAFRDLKSKSGKRSQRIQQTQEHEQQKEKEGKPRRKAKRRKSVHNSSSDGSNSGDSDDGCFHALKHTFD